jgi:hypothetical protein
MPTAARTSFLISVKFAVKPFESSNISMK